MNDPVNDKGGDQECEKAKLQPAVPFVVTPIKFGLSPGLSYDNIEHLLDAMAGLTRR
jgi:hypothetical protein